ncbi:histidine kinase [Dactylosporangium sp. NBC_01737]|uniref:sensor histidine kinase n=1 Tax=Dactylosporangium sp. NBC_01737 TaxID=2975959 RepID=UPI002E0E642B|nr:histidine kinase [Dactylosporangium sp. NBC_01737]
MKHRHLHTAAAAAAGACGLLEVVLRPPADPVLALCATLPLAVARRRPVASAATVTAAVLLMLLSGSRPPVAALLTLPAALFFVGLLAPVRTALLFATALVAYAIGPAATGGVTALGPVTLGTPLPAARQLGLLLLATGAAALTAGARRRSRAETAARTAAAGAHAGTLHAYAERRERARIARELHDIVAHHITSISVQAETARLTVPGMPPDGAARLRTIGDTARQSLTEMRRLLGVLREDTPAPALAPAPAPPQPGLDRLIALVDDASRATSGSAVRLLVRGPVRRLAPGVELTAYRVVQEALTNARRHAPGAPVEVDLRYTPDTLHVTIRDTGPSRPPVLSTRPDPPGLAGSLGLFGSFGPAGEPLRPRTWLRRSPRRPTPAAVPTTTTPATSRPVPPPGHGLLGMRERVAMAGGTLRTAPRPMGGFLVDATLPIPQPPPTATVVDAAAGVPAAAAGVGR